MSIDEPCSTVASRAGLPTFIVVIWSVAVEWQERIAVDPNVLVGKPVIRGTRLAVEFIIDLLANGWSTSDIVSNYPGITREDILACLSYASARLHEEKVYPR